MRWRALAATLAVATTFGVACAGLVGIEDLPRASTPSDGAADAAPTYAVPECASCVAGACRELELSCRRDKSCADAYRALAACGLDQVKCRYDAERGLASAASTERYLALDACRRTSCLPECHGKKGLVYAYGGPCAKCVDDGCGDAQLACMRSAPAPATGSDGGVVDGADTGAGTSGPVGNCERHIACLEAVDPPTPENSLFCDARFKTPEYDRLASCVGSAVCTSCPLPNYQCVGRYRWSIPSGPTARLTISTRDVNGVSVPATVRACSSLLCGDCTKANALAEMHVVDTAVLAVPTSGASGFVGCFRAIPDDPTKFSETLQYYGRPITRDETLVIALGRFAELDFLRANATGSTAAAPDTGIVTFVNRDCFSAQPPGLTTKLGDAKVYYLDRATGLTSPTAKVTDGSGGGVFFDVPYGTHQVITRRGDVDVATSTVTVIKGAVSFVILYPTPAL